MIPDNISLHDKLVYKKKICICEFFFFGFDNIKKIYMQCNYHLKSLEFLLTNFPWLAYLLQGVQKDDKPAIASTTN